MLIKVNGNTIRVEHISLITETNKVNVNNEYDLGYAKCSFEIHLSSRKIVHISKEACNKKYSERITMICDFAVMKNRLISLINQQQGYHKSNIDEINF